MCLPDFIRFDDIKEDNAIIGYRAWRKVIRSEDLILRSKNQNYNWSKLEGPHEIKEVNSGIYAYNNYYNNYYNNNYYNNNYNLSGIIKQYGKVAIHEGGQRSEYAKIKTLFTIRESDAKGSNEFIKWIGEFNELIRKLAVAYECDTIHFQDFKETKK